MLSANFAAGHPTVTKTSETKEFQGVVLGDAWRSLVSVSSSRSSGDTSWMVRFNIGDSIKVAVEYCDKGLWNISSLFLPRLQSRTH